MTLEEINEGKKIIAKFMGYDFHNGLFIHVDATTPIGNIFYLDEARYDVSFDWLMPAWYKFRDFHFEFKDELEHSAFRNNIGRDIAFGTIEESFKHIIKAINWYNSIKK